MFLDRIPFIKRYRERKRRETVLEYAAELGIAGFVALLWLTAAMAAFEMLIPGFAANYVPPGLLVAALAAFGGLALCGKPEKRTPRQVVLYASSGMLAAVGAFLAAWYYFTSVPETRTWLALAAGAATAALFVVFHKNDE